MTILLKSSWDSRKIPTHKQEKKPSSKGYQSRVLSGAYHALSQMWTLYFLSPKLSLFPGLINTFLKSAGLVSCNLSCTKSAHILQANLSQTAPGPTPPPTSWSITERKILRISSTFLRCKSLFMYTMYSPHIFPSHIFFYFYTWVIGD